MTHIDRLLALFRAFRERDEEAFHRTAEAIVADELGANHHAQARDLLKALSPEADERPLPRGTNGLASLPKDRRFGEALVTVTHPRITSDRVLLAEESKAQLGRVVEEHSQRIKLAKYGYLPKTKLLFWGPPGCGKTLTANWVASELNLPLGIVRLNALITSFLGETASHIQRVFDLAQSTPMVMLIDEADAVGKDRDDRNDVGELKRVVNSLLQAIDSFRSGQSIVIAASNHQYLFDAALWRRFDDIIFFPSPSPEQVKKLLAKLLNGVTVAGALESPARAASSLSFAQVERAAIEVIKSAILQDRKQILPGELSEQFRKYKRSVRNARKTNPAKSSNDE